MTSLPDNDHSFREEISVMIGSKPKNLNLFKLATLHSSVGKVTKDGFKESNERLEFLGDATLSIVFA